MNTVESTGDNDGKSSLVDWLLNFPPSLAKRSSPATAGFFAVSRSTAAKAYASLDRVDLSLDRRGLLVNKSV
ncbi:hypothetical protein WM40_07035 [Robbsia andropogonis]|uniref:Uncharacterized protein n=1 Tax=Robbsia andropogonis TaxID=28092 RepID=A0A0F5K289_9BURK|nr:hypothetical protein [Robbsia andropogonis]KKB64236.1 hypothetical protein WM40_07035 [Robbsia andropogonis]MCP1118809.1 hypothetical protein [Robbsia andropogonis]MCP1128276.1 hypothetical protein [Robbsia andropogonis]